MSGKHKRDRAAEHRAKQEAKARTEFAERVERMGGVMHGDGMPQWQTVADTRQRPHHIVAVPPRAGKQAVAEALARASYVGQTFRTVAEHASAAPRHYGDSPLHRLAPVIRQYQTLEQVSQDFGLRSQTYEDARGLFTEDDARELWSTGNRTTWPDANTTPEQILADITRVMDAMPDTRPPQYDLLRLPPPAFDMAEERFLARQLEIIRPSLYEARYSELRATSLIPMGTGLRGRSRSAYFRGVGRLKIGNSVITREIADALLPLVYKGQTRVNGNRRMFQHWITNRLAPAIQVANDVMREASDAAAILEEHLVEMYHTEDLARRRELATFVDEARASRAAARARAARVLLEVCPVNIAIEWTRQPETYSERAIRINAQYESSVFAGISYSRGTPAYFRTVDRLNVNHVSFVPGGISIGYDVP